MLVAAVSFKVVSCSNSSVTLSLACFTVRCKNLGVSAHIGWKVIFILLFTTCYYHRICEQSLSKLVVKWGLPVLHSLHIAIGIIISIIKIFKHLLNLLGSCPAVFGLCETALLKDPGREAR